MSNKVNRQQIKNFLWLLNYQFVLKFMVYAIALLPFFWFLTTSSVQGIIRGIVLMILFLMIPVIVIMETAFLLRLLPRTPSGRYPIFSPEYYSWLRGNIIAEYVSSSAFMNNLVHRTPPVKIIYYGILGYRSPATLVLAPDVKLLDPKRCDFSPFVFIGIGTILGGHTVKSLNLILEDTIIGRNVNIGSYCKFAVGVEIGRDTFIDYGVEIGMKSKIGKNVKIFAGVKIDDETVIEDNVVIGKGALIGRKSILGKNSFIGAYSSLGSRTKLPANTRLSEMTIVKN